MAKLLLLLSPALLLFACATPTYVTSHGLRVFDRTGKQVPAAAVEAMTARVVETIGDAEQLDGVDVYLIPEMIEIPQQDGTVIRTDGYTNPFENSIIASVFSDCIYVSGLVHELAHIVHDKPRGLPDWTHDDKPFWEKVKAMEKVLEGECTAEQLQAEHQARGKPKGDPLPAEEEPPRQPSEPDAAQPAPEAGGG